MASQTLRPHRSPSPSPAPSTPTHSTNQAKLTRQSLGPPPTAAASRGFAGLGISNAFNAGPRHASSGVTMGLSPRPSAASGLRSASGATPRPSSEFISRGDARTPEGKPTPGLADDSRTNRSVVQAPRKLGSHPRRNGRSEHGPKLYRRIGRYRAM